MKTIKAKVLERIALGENVFITGCRSSGKSTFISLLQSELPSYYMIISKKEGDAVNLYWQNQCIQIGQRVFDEMVVCKKGFALASIALNEFLKSHHKLLVVDEIGFLEKKVPDYLNLLVKCANQKQLLAVIRKPDHALVNRLDKLRTYTIYDLSIR